MTATVLLVGGGGREHAIAAAIRGAMDPNELTATDEDLYACSSNRNPGIERVCDGTTTLDESDPEAIVEYGEEVGADIALIGPEESAFAGVADALEEADIATVGPTADQTDIAANPAFQREFMDEHEIPGGPRYAVFDDPDEACDYIDDEEDDLVLKPVDPDSDVGVTIVGEHLSREAAMELLQDHDDERFVLEERFEGEPFTIQAIVADGELRVTPAVQVQYRLNEGSEGPLTDGMGSYSDTKLALPFMTEDDYHEAVEILYRVVNELEYYRGVLSGEFMLTSDGVKVIDFAVGFGDPAAINTLPLMNTVLVDLLEAAKEGDWLPQLSFAPRATVCKYAVPEGYPSSPQEVTRECISLDSDAALLFYGRVDADDDEFTSTGSRCFAVLGIGETIHEAESHAAEALDGIDLDGFHVRADIGTSAHVGAVSERSAERRNES